MFKHKKQTIDGVQQTQVKIKDDYDKALTWESSRLDLIYKSERKAWTLVRVLITCIVLLCIAIACTMPLKTVEPFVIEVDKSNGMSTVLHIANTKDIPVSELMNKYWLSKYVLAREGYDWRTLNQEYVKVRELSLPNVFDVYASQYGQHKDSLEMRLKDNYRVQVELKSIVVNSESIATIRFDKKTINNKTGSQEGINSWTATIGFEYFPDFKVPEERRIVNPFGFKVTSYRVDPEFGGID